MSHLCISYRAETLRKKKIIAGQPSAGGGAKETTASLRAF